MVREGSTEHNLADLLPVLQRHRARRALLVTDDRTPTDLRDEGHLDHALRQAIALSPDDPDALSGKAQRDSDVAPGDPGGDSDAVPNDLAVPARDAGGNSGDASA